MKITVAQLLDRVNILATKMHYGIQKGNEEAVEEYINFCKKEIEIEEE